MRIYVCGSGNGGRKLGKCDGCGRGSEMRKTDGDLTGDWHFTMELNELNELY